MKRMFLILSILSLCLLILSACDLPSWNYRDDPVDDGVCRHDVVIDEGIPATCTEDGLSEGSHCSICGEVLSEQAVIPKNHISVTDPAEKGDCNTNGKSEGSHCSECGIVFVAQITLPKGHPDENGDFTCDICGVVPSVTYEEFGAVGDGVTNDFVAMLETHKYANEHHLTVIGKPGAEYLITYTSGKSIPIKTNVVWDGCNIVIDDRALTYSDTLERTSSIFLISEDKGSRMIYNDDPIVQRIVADGGLKTDTRRIDYAPGKDVMLVPYDSTRKVYIRYGGNANSGSPQHEVLIVHEDGELDKKTPVMLDYNNISYIKEYYIDDSPIIIRGGVLTTRANASRCKYDYFSRNITIRRSNVTVSGVEHRITDEGDTGAPYSGFFSVAECNNVRFEDCMLAAHRMYVEERAHNTDGSVKTWGTQMGTYDIGGSMANDIYFYNCRQSNFYSPDGKYTGRWYDADGNTGLNNKGATATLWGIMGTNYCKNITYDGCTLNRFDAHSGVYNATIKNTTTAMISLIGGGVALLENSTVHSGNLITLREDYGSTWDGQISFRNVKWYATSNTPTMISGRYVNHDFGYETHLPSVTVDNLTVVGRTPTRINVFSSFSLGADRDPSLKTVNGVAAKNIMHYPRSRAVVIKNNMNGYSFASASGGFFAKLELVEIE